MVAKHFFRGMTANEILHEHIFLRIHTKGVWLVPFIKIYIKALFVLDIDPFRILSYTIQYFFTVYIMVQTFMTNIVNLLI